MRKFIGRLLIFPIKLYQRFISPLLPRTCRYYPSCSNYSIEAIEKYGPFWGSIKAVSRIMRCHPLFPGGYEPVEKGWPHIKESDKK